MVYKLVAKHKQLGELAYKSLRAGRPRQRLNPLFVKKVVEIRKENDYGSEKIHYVLQQDGFTVSQRQIQNILNAQSLTEPCEKRRGQRKYVRYQWPFSNYMWHCDWSEYEGKQYMAYIDDRSRKIMAAGEFSNATQEYALFVLYQAILMNEACPVIILSDKGSQFYANKKTAQGERPLSGFEEELNLLGIELWTSRRNHPQTNGKMEKWFDTFKKRKKKHPDETFHDIVKWYNEKRIHHALSYKTPEQAYQENL